jgi:uncharacterized cupin superfamily protein
VIPEAPLERTEHGLRPAADGWYVLNARDAPWLARPDGTASCETEGDVEFGQVGVFIRVLSPGSPLGLYHWEADQEGFLVLSGEALLIVEGEERPLRQWDFFHCPPGTRHIIVGAGETTCVLLSIGSREHQRGREWGAYTVDEAALRRGAGVAEETADAEQAYAGFPRYSWTPYREGWLPGLGA